MLSIRIFCFVFALGFCVANADPILSLTRVAGGFSKPVQVTFAPGDANHIYVTEKTGTVRKVNTLTNSVSPTPFFTFPAGEIGSLHEQGLLGITFHPNYATNDLFFTCDPVDPEYSRMCML